MADIKPFMAIRPRKELAQSVAELPHDIYSREEARVVAFGNKNSFLKIDKAEIAFGNLINREDDIVYRTSSENLAKMISDGVFVKDKQECMYIYSLEYNEKIYRGIVACVAIDEYINGNIKKRKKLRVNKEEDRYKHIKAVNANIAPVLLAYENKEEIDEIINAYVNENEPVYDFIDDEKVVQKVWVINNEKTIDKLENLFGTIEKLYLADGNYENSAAARIALDRREVSRRGETAYDYCLSALFSDKELDTRGINIGIKNLNELSKEEFISKIKNKYVIEKVSESYKPSKSEFTMYDGDWYKLELKNSGNLYFDSYAFEKEVLGNILNEDDPVESENIISNYGEEDFKIFKNLVDNGEIMVVFGNYKVSVKEFMELVDNDNVVSLKSIIFEPKLRNGLFIHDLK